MIAEGKRKNIIDALSSPKKEKWTWLSDSSDYLQKDGERDDKSTDFYPSVLKQQVRTDKMESQNDIN